MSVADTGRLVLLGGGGHALVTAEAALAAGWLLEGFLDDAEDTQLAGHAQRLGPLSLASEHAKSAALHLAIGSLETRRKLLPGVRGWFATIIHPTAWVSPSSIVGAGSLIGAGSVLQGRARLGAHCIINTGAIVEHDCTLGDNVHIAPRATLTGEVTIGSHSMIGAAAVVLPGVTVGAHCIIGAGAVVTKDVPANTVVVGIPARPR